MKAKYFRHVNVIMAANQKAYQPLPALRVIVPQLKLNDPNGHVVFCMGMSFKERMRVLFLGRVWVSLMTFGQLTPSHVSTYRKDMYHHPDFEVSRIRQFFDLGAFLYFKV